MNQQKFRVVIAHDVFPSNKIVFGVRQPGCTNRSITSCERRGHRWCRNAKTLKSAYGTARIFATYSGLNPKIGFTK